VADGQAELDPAEVCPGPPEAVFWPPEQLHRWTPVAVLPGRPIEESAAEIAAIEVCLSCLGWRPRQYTRVSVSP
jgi:hypothetical protein